MLMVGWANDMFAGTQDDGIYLDPSQEFTLDTPAGEATLVALPNSLTKPFLLNPLQALVPLGTPTPWPRPDPRGGWLPDALSGRRRGADAAANPVLTGRPTPNTA